MWDAIDLWDVRRVLEPQSPLLELTRDPLRILTVEFPCWIVRNIRKDEVMISNA